MRAGQASKARHLIAHQVVSAHRQHQAEQASGHTHVDKHVKSRRLRPQCHSDEANQRIALIADGAVSQKPLNIVLR